jgi:hypothetical protein
MYSLSIWTLPWLTFVYFLCDHFPYSSTRFGNLLCSSTPFALTTYRPSLPTSHLAPIHLLHLHTHGRLSSCFPPYLRNLRVPCFLAFTATFGFMPPTSRVDTHHHLSLTSSVAQPTSAFVTHLPFIPLRMLTFTCHLLLPMLPSHLALTCHCSIFCMTTLPVACSFQPSAAFQIYAMLLACGPYLSIVICHLLLPALCYLLASGCHPLLRILAIVHHPSFTSSYMLTIVCLPVHHYLLPISSCFPLCLPRISVPAITPRICLHFLHIYPCSFLVLLQFIPDTNESTPFQPGPRQTPSNLLTDFNVLDKMTIPPQTLILIYQAFTICNITAPII